jgi:hypothetical protein
MRQQRSQFEQEMQYDLQRQQALPAASGWHIHTPEETRQESVRE